MRLHEPSVCVIYGFRTRCEPQTGAVELRPNSCADRGTLAPRKVAAPTVVPIDGNARSADVAPSSLAVVEPRRQAHGLGAVLLGAQDLGQAVAPIFPVYCSGNDFAMQE